jgi:putative transposase
MTELRREVRVRSGRDPEPSLVILDAQQARTGRQGPSFHDAGGLGRGRVQRGSKRSLLVDVLGLPVAVHVTSSRPHDSTAGRELLDAALPELPRVELVVADRGYRGLTHHVAARHGRCFEVRHWDTKPDGFKPIAQVWRVEDAFAQLGRWRRLSRSFEGTAASATTWCQVAAVGLLFGRLAALE